MMSASEKAKEGSTATLAPVVARVNSRVSHAPLLAPLPSLPRSTFWIKLHATSILTGTLIGTIQFVRTNSPDSQLVQHFCDSPGSSYFPISVHQTG